MRAFRRPALPAVFEPEVGAAAETIGLLATMRTIFPALRHRTLLSVLLVAVTVSVVTIIAVSMQRGEEAPVPAPEPLGPPVFVTGGTPSQ